MMNDFELDLEVQRRWEQALRRNNRQRMMHWIIAGLAGMICVVLVVLWSQW